MDQRTRKLMIRHKVLHPSDDVDRLYVSRNEGGRGHARIEDSVNTSIQRLEGYIEKHEGGLITAIKNDNDNTITNKITITRKQKCDEKQLYGFFKWLIKARIDKTQQNSKCRLCGDWDETIYHIISESIKFAQTEYKTRNDWVGKVIHWEMCKKCKLDYKNKF